MFAKLDIPIFGIVENMAYLDMPDGSRQYIFGNGGGERLAETDGTEFLGSIPIDAKVGFGNDNGLPVVKQEPLSAVGEDLVKIARNIAAEASKAAYKKSQAE
jgi:ATP-binding protein involved in chromosome partitioning